MSNRSEIDVRVAAKSFETDAIALFELVAVDGETLPSFEAGSHIDVHVPGGPVRQYSLCNHPAETHRYLIGVLKDPNSRGGSVAMHEQLHEGDTLTISVPRNHFPLAADATHHVLLAGGIGVTPILCMAEALGADASFEMHYCTRSQDVTAFQSRLADASFADKVHHHFDDGAPEQRFDAAVRLASPIAGTHVYVCGPGGFMDWVLGTARAAGWPEEQLHYEFFSAEIDTEGDEGFEVELKSSGLVVNVPDDMTVVAALALQGVEIETSCQQGVCGTCLTGVLEGIPDHKDLYLMAHEHEANDQFMPCCSRSVSPRLVLDL
jgi:vanillate O-demethylase ferredoxin subunit